MPATSFVSTRVIRGRQPGGPATAQPLLDRAYPTINVANVLGSGLRGNRRRRALRLCHHYGLSGFDVGFQPGDPIGEHSDIVGVSLDQGAVLLFQVDQAV